MQECRDESDIYNYKQIQLLNNKFTNGILGGTLDLAWLLAAYVFDWWILVLYRLYWSFVELVFIFLVQNTHFLSWAHVYDPHPG